MTTWNGQVHPAAELFPMLDDEAAQALADDINERGLAEPGWLMPDGTLLDGRNRQRACELAGVEMRWKVYGDDDPIGFVLSLNLQRRHLTTGQKAAVGVEVLPLYEAQAKDRISAAVSAANIEQPKRSDSRWAELPTLKDVKKEKQRARDEAAAAVGVSGKAIAQGKRVATQAPDLWDKVKAGTLALDAAEKQTKRRLAQQEEQAAREIKVAAVSVDAEGPNWRLLAGDFRERLLELPAGSVDLIVTDPPYPAEFLPLYSDLSRLARHVLADDGICLVMTGKIQLDKVMLMLAEQLNYGWVYAVPLASSTRIMGRHIAQEWKPLVAFTKGKWPAGRIEWHPDLLSVGRRSKAEYRWQQDGDQLINLVHLLCPPGGTVLDPFAGTGEFGKTALRAGRRFIGCEIDQARFAVAEGVLDERACA